MTFTRRPSFQQRLKSTTPLQEGESGVAPAPSAMPAAPNIIPSENVKKDVDVKEDAKEQTSALPILPASGTTTPTVPSVRVPPLAKKVAPPVPREHDPEDVPHDWQDDEPSVAPSWIKPKPVLSPSRFLRASEAQVAPVTVPCSLSTLLWELWGVVEQWKEIQGHPWVATSCPKCHEDALVADQQGGAFVCLNCAFHGSALTQPRMYRGTWVQGFNQYLKASTRTLSPFSNAYAMGCFAHAFHPVNKSLEEAWHIWCMDEHGDIKDALVSFNTEDTRPTWYRPDVPGFPLGWNSVQQGRVVLVLDPIDWIALQDAGVPNVVCLPPDLDGSLPTSSAWKSLEFMEGKLKESSEIVLAFSNTPKERALEEELGRRMDKERCFRVRWKNPSMSIDEDEVAPPEEPNAQRALVMYGADNVQSMVELAQPFPVAGVYELDDIDDRFEELYNTGLAPGASTGWPSMDPHYTVKTGQWSLVTGIPGHGKSSWLDGLLVNLATLHGWRIGMFSPENQPVERHFASLMEKKIGKPFSEGHLPRISVQEKNATKRWLNDKFKVILPNEEDGQWTLDAVLRLAKVLVYRYGIRGLVIDPWNELDHSRTSNVSETTYISECLTKIRRFARLYDVHVWIVAHPTKLEKKADGKYPVATPYDVAGGAHWRNKADCAISVYRNVDEDDFDISDVYIQKIRFREVGSLGMVSLRTEPASGAYVDDIDHAKRQYVKQSGQYQPSSAQRLPKPRTYSALPHIGYDQNF